MPKTNQSYWVNKISRNKNRDKEAQKRLKEMGWSILVIWECQLKNLTALTRTIDKFLGPSKQTISKKGGYRMIPVQEMVVVTNKGRRFQMYIENPEDNKFKWWFFAYDPILPMSGGYGPATVHNSPNEAFQEMILFIMEWVKKRNNNDAISYIDNPCNCELVEGQFQKIVIDQCQPAFPVKINGITV